MTSFPSNRPAASELPSAPTARAAADSASRLVSGRASHPVAAGSGARLGAALLAYMLGVTLVITLLPFQFDWPSRWRVMITGDAVDVIANVLLFLPLGFLYRLTRRESVGHSTLPILWIGALVSMGIEVAQLFEQERYTSVLDVGTNALGAWLGALAFDRLARRTRVDGVLIGRLSLELPLMGLVYLVVPLLWLNGLATGPDAERGALALLLGVFGASLLGGMQRHHFGPVRSFSPTATAGAAAVWFLTGAFPSLTGNPWMLVVGTALVCALTCWRGRIPVDSRASNRRFEVPLLVSAAPAYGAYLALLTLAPLIHGVAPWQVGWSFPGVASEWTKVEILRFLEQGAAFTLLGYAVAEFRGREVESFRRALGRLLGWALAATVLGEGVRGFHAGHGASVGRGCVLLGAAVYGGWLYYVQRAQVLELLSRSSEEIPKTIAVRAGGAADAA